MPLVRCIKCGRGMSQCDGFIPIDPPGTSNRRWVCTDCAAPEQMHTIPKGVRELSNIVAQKEIFK